MSNTDFFLAPPTSKGAARFPYALVFTPIPLVSWLFPFIGHVGICRSDGVILDFLGDHFVSVDRFGFGGRPSRYLSLSPPSPHHDHAIATAKHEYESSHRYSFLNDNCHCFVALALSLMGYNGIDRWSMARVAILLFFRAKHVGWRGLLRTWLPWCIVMGFGLGFGRWRFAMAYLATFLAVSTLFLLVLSPRAVSRLQLTSRVPIVPPPM